MNIQREVVDRLEGAIQAERDAWQEHADSQAVAFAEWIGNNYAQSNNSGSLWMSHDANEFDTAFTTQQLFTKFKESQQ